MLDYCAKCGKNLDSDKQLTCEGLCYQKFHACCVNIPDNMLVLINGSDNLFWKCSNCSNLSVPDLLQRLSVLSKDLSNLLKVAKSPSCSSDVDSLPDYLTVNKDPILAKKSLTNSVSSAKSVAVIDKVGESSGTVLKRQLRSSSSSSKKVDNKPKKVPTKSTVLNSSARNDKKLTGIAADSVVGSAIEVETADDEAVVVARDTELKNSKVTVIAGSSDGNGSKLLDKVDDGDTVKHNIQRQFKIIGSSSCCEISAIQKLRWLHLSRVVCTHLKKKKKGLD